MKPEITADLLIEDMIEHYPDTTAFLQERGLQCFVCGEPVWGTVAELAAEKRYTEEQIKALVEELRETFMKE